MHCKMADLLQFCKQLPKVELHAHLNGSISEATMQKLLRRHINKVSKDGNSYTAEAWQTVIAKGEKRTLEECFAMFKMIHTVVDDEEAVAMVAHDVVSEFAADKVVYLELRSTPRANPKTGTTKSLYIDAILRGIDSAVSECAHHINISLLLSVDRRQPVVEANDTVELALKYSNTCSSNHHARVVGIDLSGDPNAGDMKELLPVLVAAKEKGLKFSLHLSEIPDRNSETKLLLSADPDRIGHCTFMHTEVGGSDEIVDIVLKKQIPIEICLTSNLKCKTVSSYNGHHLGFWKIRNHPFVICTDDKGVFATSLSEEYFVAAQTFGLSKEQLKQISLQAVDYTFESEEFRSALKHHWVGCETA